MIQSEIIGGLVYQSHQSGIETFRRPGTLREASTLPIAPIWNWNDRKLATFSAKINLPIAPIWNWNMRFLNLFKWLFATNRTNLELKRWSFCWSLSCPYSTNRTNLELKRSFPGWLNWCPLTTNRTNLELKRKINCERVEAAFATNRTNLELKLRCKSRHIHSICYQSHQSGIETWRLGGNL